MKTQMIAEAAGRLNANPPWFTGLSGEVSHRRTQRPCQDEGSPEQRHAGYVRPEVRIAITAKATKTRAPPW